MGLPAPAAPAPGDLSLFLVGLAVGTVARGSEARRIPRDGRERFQRLVVRQRKQSEKHHRLLEAHIQNLNTELDAAQKEMSIDSLTAVYNRLTFDQRIEALRQQCQNTGDAFALMIFDVDHFKQINDTHGHPVGDRLLTTVAQNAKQSLRPDDFVARYGGDEFVIVLRCESIVDARRVLERFRVTVSQGFLYKADDGKDQQVMATISGGIAFLRESDTVESLIRRADKALYLAKDRGRNEICAETELQGSMLEG